MVDTIRIEEVYTGDEADFIKETLDMCDGMNEHESILYAFKLLYAVKFHNHNEKGGAK